ncbi:MAG: FMN-binding protein [Coriobacteriia bacterium]
MSSARARKVLTRIGITLLVIVVALGAMVLITEGQRREDRNVVIADVDFSQVPDGVYRGAYEGWNQFEVITTVSGGRVTQIEIADDSRDPSSAVTDEVFERVLSEQSLGLDAVSGATITTNALLKAVERALVEQRTE